MYKTWSLHRGSSGVIDIGRGPGHKRLQSVAAIAAIMSQKSTAVENAVSDLSVKHEDLSMSLETMDSAVAEVITKLDRRTKAQHNDLDALRVVLNELISRDKKRAGQLSELQTQFKKVTAGAQVDEKLVFTVNETAAMTKKLATRLAFLGSRSARGKIEVAGAEFTKAFGDIASDLANSSAGSSLVGSLNVQGPATGSRSEIEVDLTNPPPSEEPQVEEDPEESAQLPGLI